MTHSTPVPSDWVLLASRIKIRGDPLMFVIAPTQQNKIFYCNSNWPTPWSFLEAIFLSFCIWSFFLFHFPLTCAFAAFWMHELFIILWIRSWLIWIVFIISDGNNLLQHFVKMLWSLLYKSGCHSSVTTAKTDKK